MELTKDTNTSMLVERALCVTLLNTMIQHWHLYRNYTADIFKFMLASTKSEHDEVSLVAVEFWAFYAKDQSKDQTYLKNFFPSLCPVLIQRIRYTPQLLSMIDWESDDCSKIPDKDINIKPLHYQERTDQNEPKTTQETDEDETRWNIRKASANILDFLCQCPDLVQPLLKQIGPLIVNHLGSSDYLVEIYYYYFFFFLIIICIP
ncbi:transportin 1, partial [Reticulomyxa filosa]